MKTANIYNRILVGCCLAVALAWLCGCGDGRSERLRAIDAIMEDNPALALAQLDSVDAATLSDADYPYYCLLYTQAQVKNNIVLTDDSLIRVAYEAYANSSDDDLRRRANYYNAQVAYYAKDYRTAMRDILPAYEIAKEDDDPYWTAKAAEIIGDIYFYLFNYRSAEVYKREAAQKYKEAGKDLNHRYALSDLNATLMNEGKEEEALRLIDSLHTVVKSEEPMDTALYEYVKMSLYAYYAKTGQPDELRKLINQGLNMNEGDDAEMDLAIVVSNALNNEGQTDEAELYLTKASEIAPSENDRARVLYASFKQSLQNKDFAKAAPLGDTLIYMQSNLMRDVINESVTGVQSDFYHLKANRKQREARTLFLLVIALLGVIMIVTVLFIINHRLRMRAKNSELEALLESIRSYESEARLTEKENRRLETELFSQSKAVNEHHHQHGYIMPRQDVARDDIEKLLHERWQTLNTLCDEFYERWDNEITRPTILLKIRKEIDRQTSPKNVALIEKCVDKYMGGIMTLLRHELPALHEDDYVFLSLLYAGMTTRTVCVSMNMKMSLFYKRRERLHERIAMSDAPHKELFLNKMGRAPKQTKVN